MRTAGRQSWWTHHPTRPVWLRLLARHDLAVTALLVTHGHIDHVGGAGPVARSTRAVAYIHPDDDFLTLDPDRQTGERGQMLPETW